MNSTSTPDSACRNMSSRCTTDYSPASFEQETERKKGLAFFITSSAPETGRYGVIFPLQPSAAKRAAGRVSGSSSAFFSGLERHANQLALAEDAMFCNYPANCAGGPAVFIVEADFHAVFSGFLHAVLDLFEAFPAQARTAESHLRMHEESAGSHFSCRILI